MSSAPFAPAVVATHGSTDPTAPLVVLLHGGGSDEQQILTLAPHLPTGVAYAAVRAPIAEGGGYAWFANHGSEDPQAYLVAEVGEFAHLHPAHDGSMHLVFPADLAADVSAKGWGRPHMWAGTRLSPGFMMVFGPRDEAELAVVRGIVEASHAYASGATALVG